MKLSIIIVNYNVKYFLEQCLLSVREAMQGIDAEIFVVDNNSTDESVEYLHPKFPNVNFIVNKENKGFSKANNQAILQSSGEYVLLLNPDTVIGENALKRTCDFMNTHKDAGGLGVRMIDGFGSFLPESKRGFPSPWTSFCKLVGLSKLFPFSPLFAKYHLKYLNENEIHSVDVLSGAFMLLRRDVLNITGLLDEDFFMYGEDIDLSYRIKQNGYNNYYFPETIIHYKGESTKKNLKYVRIFHEAMLIFFKKHYSHYNFLSRFFVNLSIYFIRGISSVNKIIIANKGKNKNAENNETEKAQSEILFDTSKISYEKIISEMSSTSDNNRFRYWIYHPELEIAISSNEVLINKDKIYGIIRK